MSWLAALAGMGACYTFARLSSHVLFWISVSTIGPLWSLRAIQSYAAHTVSVKSEFKDKVYDFTPREAQRVSDAVSWADFAFSVACVVLLSVSIVMLLIGRQ